MHTLNCKGRLLTITSPIVMGIINTTPDSFYSSSRTSQNKILDKAEQMITEGAAILDLGGQSTRPGSEQVSVEEELKRVIPAIESIHQKFPEQLISVDTFYARVAKEAVAAGASIVNDVSAGTLDEAMFETVAALRIPYVLMHMKGQPKNMQQQPQYENVVTEVFDSLNQNLARLTSLGVHDVLVDPGFGFGKTIAHNFKLLQLLSFFTHLQKPLLVGLSRKATVYKTLGTSAEEALNGTTVMHTIALLNGANILRAHDVKEAMEAIKLVEAYRQ
jgi:dihydropteroate synthase